jgi:hypothetical protein
LKKKKKKQAVRPEMRKKIETQSWVPGDGLSGVVDENV